jgi:hypothetical protein
MLKPNWSETGVDVRARPWESAIGLGTTFHPIFTREHCPVIKLLISWRSLRDSNPCYSLERAVRASLGSDEDVGAAKTPQSGDRPWTHRSICHDDGRIVGSHAAMQRLQIRAAARGPLRKVFRPICRVILPAIENAPVNCLVDRSGCR